MNEQRTAAEGRALRSLDGLSIGDAFGECFFHLEHHWPDDLRRQGDELPLPEPPWQWTDDTAMAIQIVEHLVEAGSIDPDALAMRFAKAHHAEPWRGYGPGARILLTSVHAGRPWRDAASQAFGGLGSMGNGSAMRVAPLGAYFADRVDEPGTILAEAERSAIVTHPHPEGVAGAQAVALAAALAAGRSPEEFRDRLLDYVLESLPQSEVRRALAAAAELGLDAEPVKVARELGNGSRILCTDTVPTCLWLAARFGSDYEEAMFRTAFLAGDIDTNCAIVGGIVSVLEGVEPPDEWRRRRMPVPLQS